MDARSFVPAVLAATIGGCAFGPAPGEDTRERPDSPAAFIQYVVEDIEAHEWQSLLASSDPTHFEARVVGGGLSEVEYLAELLGLDREGNTLRTGEAVTWSDLERIEAATLSPLGDDQGPPFRYGGQVTLSSGEVVGIETYVTQVQGRYVLTGQGE